MTVKQTRKMLCMEGIGYAAFSMAGAVLLGIPVSFAAFQAMNVYDISYSIPWLSNLLLFAVILLLCAAAPVCIYERTQNKSVIERLRNVGDN